MVSLALTCATFSARWKTVVSVAFILGGIFQVLTVSVLLGSDICDESRECTLSFGAGITIGSIVIALFAGTAVLALPPVPSTKVAAAALARMLSPAGRQERDKQEELVGTDDETHGAAVDTFETEPDEDLEGNEQHIQLG